MAQGLQTDSSRVVVAGTGHRPQKLNPLDAFDRKFGFTPEAHEALLAYLAAHRDLYWTATFREQMRWVRDHEAPQD